MRTFLMLVAVLLSAQMLSAQDMKQGTLTNVTRLTDGTGRYENPRWSPDGTKVAFTNYGYNSLYVMDANGGNKKQLSNSASVGYMYQWSADSREILVRDLRWESSAMGRKKRCQAAWSIDLNGVQTRLTDDVERMQPASWRYSVSGEKSIMALDANVISNVKLCALPKSIASNMKLRPAMNISLIADGDALYVVNSRGNKTKIHEGHSFCPAISPDGKKVVFNHVNDVCVINIDGTGKKVLGRGFNPTWVNNSQVVFEKTTDDGHTYTSGELYMINVNGSGLKQLTSTPNMIEMNPAVSADGTKIVFASFNDGQIYSADLK